MIDVSTWVTHTSREPSDFFLNQLHARWREAAADGTHRAPTAGACVWHEGPVHSLVLAHVDRAAHKRRRRALYVSREACDAGDGGSHGVTPMSEFVPGDPYGPEELRVAHSGDVSALAHAFDIAAADPQVLATTVLTESEFGDPDFYHLHSARRANPLSHGVVLPFLYIPRERGAVEHPDVTAEREDVLRAHGYTSYTIDLDCTDLGPVSIHRELALLMEDVWDEIAGIKADAAARVLINEPSWPLIVIRASGTWEYDRTSADALARAS